MPHKPGHEPDAVWPRTVVALGVGLLGLVVLAMLITGLALKWMVPGSPLTVAGQEWQLQNRVPGVQPNQAYERERILADEQAFLKQYAWQDDEHTIARIPIVRAIELQAHGIGFQSVNEKNTSQAGSQRHGETESRQ